MRLIKMVGKVNRSTTPQNNEGPKLLEFFDLARNQKIVKHLFGAGLVDEDIAKKLE